ncbi:hypothetical protein ACIQV3_19235 [Streptomyces sp. NPDC099050]|uniref:hypothetical protein n=1 Tax=Streptomyces sp. NPDC099050 TaxID=3366100 RepID=UPI0037FD71FC
MRFLLVHGTGVRRERHDTLFALIRDRLTARFPGAVVDSCFWGERYGATLSAHGRSVPGLGAPGAVSGADDEEVAEWGLLVADPLCELRVLAEAGWDTGAGGGSDGGSGGGPWGDPEGDFGREPGGDSSGDFDGDSSGGFGGDLGDDAFAMPGVRSAGERVLELLAEVPGVQGGGEQAALLLGTGLAAGFPAALEAVSRSAEAARAGGRATAEPQARELAKVLARAVTAAALASAGAEADCTGTERDRLVELITARLGGDARVPGARAAAVLGRLAMRVTTQPLLNAWRGSLTVGATPALGDILRYQARGADLRTFLHERITAEPGPTVLIGHSLGGIALVDLLALAAARGEPVPGVELLVTVGSQAPFLHELGALAGVVPGSKLPYAFPRWLNVYDRQDVLSYLAEPVFPGDPRVSDQEIGSRQPFPACHSAYWKQDSLYACIERAVAEAEIG